MVEQHYRKERIIRSGVGTLDKANMIKRKLHVAFPNYPVRASYPLKEKIQKTETSSAAEIHIFAAIPGSNQFVKTIDAIKDSLVSVAGFCLLPIESSDMVKTLSAKMSKGRKRAQWSVFMGQHKDGGLRQIVTKNGELALTRMTPVVESDKDAEIWSKEVHNEFQSTMSYLARFGYQSEDGLDVILIANSEPGKLFESFVEEDCAVNVLTVTEAARILGVHLGRQEDLHFADSLHIAWAGRKTKFILPMKAIQIDQVSKPRQVALLFSLVMLCSVLFFSYQIAGKYGALLTASSEFNDAKERQAQLKVQYQKEVQRKEALGFDVRLVQSSIAVHEMLENNQIHSLSLLNAIGTALGKDLRVDKIEIERPSYVPLNNLMKMSFGGRKKTEGTSLFQVTMKMIYPSTTNIDKGNQEVKDLKKRLEMLLSNHEIKVTKFLKDYEYVEEIVVETGASDNQNVKQDFIAELVIKGPPVNKGGNVR